MPMKDSLQKNLTLNVHDLPCADFNSFVAFHENCSKREMKNTKNRRRKLYFILNNNTDTGNCFQNI